MLKSITFCENSLLRGLRSAFHSVVTFLHLTLVAMLRKFVAPALSSELGVLVVSPGGVATTSLIEHIAKFGVVNRADDSDLLKHLPWPPKAVLKAKYLKVIFILGRPEVVYASIRRRGWIAVQGSKLGSLGSVILPNSHAKAAFIRAVDLQWQRWVSADVPHFLAIQYDDLWDQKEAISMFLGIKDEQFLADFPTRVNRKSTHDA